MEIQKTSNSHFLMVRKYSENENQREKQNKTKQNKTQQP